MLRVHKNKSPKARRALGALLRAAARVLNLPRRSEIWITFDATHERYEAADERVAEAKRAWMTQRRAVSEARRAVMEVIDRLAGSLAADGLSRLRPFSAFGLGTPRAIRRMSDPRRVEGTSALATRVLGWEGRSEVSASLAKRLEMRTQVLAAALAALPPLEEAYQRSLHEREALGRLWERQLRALRYWALGEEADGGGDVYGTLFAGIALSYKKRPRV